MFLDDPGSKPARAKGRAASKLAAEAKERNDMMETTEHKIYVTVKGVNVGDGG